MPHYIHCIPTRISSYFHSMLHINYCITCITSASPAPPAAPPTPRPTQAHSLHPRCGHEWEAHGDVRYPPARAAHGSDPSIRAGPRYQLALWAAGAGEKEPPVCAASQRRANHISERRSEQPACPSCAAFPKLEASTAPPSTPLYLSSRSIFLAPLLQLIHRRRHWVQQVGLSCL